MTQIVYASEAEEDLNEIWAYIASDNQDAADRTIDNIIKKAKALLSHPRLGRQRDELAAGLRCLYIGNYLLFYRLSGADIEVARVLHSARDIERQFH